MQTSKGFLFSAGALVGAAGVFGAYSLKQKLQEQQTQQSHSKIFRYGYPQSHISELSYRAHSLAYDHSKKVPLWVAECIDKNMVTSKEAHRKKSDFQPDPNLPGEHCSRNEDYRRSGWSRGHMAPAGNYKHCQESMNDTFLLTNIVPQDIDKNAGYWNSLEDYCRRLAKQYPDVNVISGPLFLPQTDSQTKKKHIQYQVIGENNVAVPTHLYKVVLVSSTPDPMLGVFIVPNKPIKDVNLTEFQVSLELLEKHIGTKFHHKLDRTKVRDLCKIDGCKLKSQKDWAAIELHKQVKGAKTSEELDNIVQKAQAKGLGNDKQLLNSNSKRRIELGDSNA